MRAEQIKLRQLMAKMFSRELFGDPYKDMNSNDYIKVIVLLGLIIETTKKQMNKVIDAHVKKITADVICRECKNGNLRQTRSGSKRAKCLTCGALWQLMK